MKKQLAKLACTALSLSLLFTACSGGGQSSTGGEAGGTSATGTANGGGTTITIMTAMAYGTEELDKVFEAFKDAHPGVEIDAQHLPNDFDQIVASRVNSGDIPDIFVQQTGSSTELYSEYAYEWTNEAVLSSFHDSALEASRLPDGRLVSLPWTYESMAFIINQDIFDEVGITQLPTTISGLREVCEQIAAAGYTPFSIAMQDAWVLAHIASHFVAPEADSAHEIVAAINAGTLTFADMGYFKNLFEVMDLMVEYGPAKPLEVDWELSENDVANSKAAIIHMGDWCEATLQEFNSETNYSFMPVPVGDDGEAPTFLSSISWQFITHKDSENLDLAKELLEFMLTSDIGIEWMTQGVKAIPSAKTDRQPDGVLAMSAQEFINSGESLPWNHTLWPSNYNNKIGAELQRYALGSATAEEVMETAMEMWNS